MYTVSFLSVVLASLSSMVVGFAWYHRAVFGGAWQRAVNMSPDMVEHGHRRTLVMTAIGFAASLLVAYVMGHLMVVMGVYDWRGALQVGIWCWIGFVAPTMLGMVLWEQQSFRLYLINALYWLVALMIMSLVLFYAETTFGGSSYTSGYQDAAGSDIQMMD
jgi:hypothetical protein